MNKDKNNPVRGKTLTGFYIIGAFEISGMKPYYNAVYELRLRGFESYNPISFIFNTLDRSEFFEKNLEKLSEHDAVLLLPNWDKSEYSQVEFCMAKEMNLFIYAFVGGQLQLLE